MKYSFLCLLIIAFFIFPGVSLAQEDGTVPITPPVQVIDYPLPYPGILPNNPLYPIKMIRDKIVLLIIVDPYKKAKFNLLQSDKRIQAAIFLVKEDKKNGKLAVTTIEKGENYFHDAVFEAASLKKQGQDIGRFLDNLNNSASKHLLLMTGLQESLPSEKEELSRLKSRMQSYQLQVVQIKN